MECDVYEIYYITEKMQTNLSLIFHLNFHLHCRANKRACFRDLPSHVINKKSLNARAIKDLHNS